MRRMLSFTILPGAIAACSLLIDTAGLQDGSDAGDAGDVGDAGGDVPTGCPGIDLQTSAEHCGACGHSCRGDPCSRGRCAPTVLASDTGQVLGLDVDAANLYIASRTTSEILKVPKAGGAKSVLASGDGDIRFAPRDLVVHANAVYWINASASSLQSKPVLRFDLASSTLTALGPPFADGAGGLVADDTYVFFSRINSDSTLHRIARGTPTQSSAMASRFGTPVQLQSDETHVYVTTDEGLLRLPRTDNVVMPVGAVGASRGLALLDEFAFVTTADGRVLRVHKETGDVTVLAEGQPSPRGIVVDATHAYWTSSEGGFIGRALSDGSGSVERIAENQLEPTALCQDGERVYWSNLGASGSIMRLAK